MVSFVSNEKEHFIPIVLESYIKEAESVGRSATAECGRDRWAPCPWSHASRKRGYQAWLPGALRLCLQCAAL